MNRSLLVCFGALGVVVLAIAAAAVTLTQDDKIPIVQLVPSDRAAGSAIDPGRAELRRCRDIGEEALRDGVCLNLWKENRERFLGNRSSPAAPSPSIPDEEH